MDILYKDWSEFLALRTRHRARFAIVGGHAVAVHARPRYTEDLDVLVDPTPANARRLRAALAEFGFGDQAPSVELLATPRKVLMIGRKPYRIDVPRRDSAMPLLQEDTKALETGLRLLQHRSVDVPGQGRLCTQACAGAAVGPAQLAAATRNLAAPPL
jgi:hypothetical protein